MADKLRMYKYVFYPIMTKYGTMAGRASRAEYWSITVFLTILALVIYAVADNIPPTQSVGNIFFLVSEVILIIPWICVSIRRLHDTNRSGWYYFTYLIPIIGIIILLIFMCYQGTHGKNRYGSDPLGKL